MNKTLAILGAGHLGQQIAHFAIADKHYKKVVFFDDFSKEKNVDGYSILGDAEAIIAEFRKNSFDELIIGIGYHHLEARKRLFQKLENDIPFGTILHTSAWVDPSAVIEKGCVIYPRCCIDSNALIAENTILNLSCTIAHDSCVGAHSFLGPSVSIAGFSNVGERCFLGINTTLTDTISICPGTFTGAAAVLIKDITESGLYVGNPAKKIR